MPLEDCVNRVFESSFFMSEFGEGRSSGARMSSRKLLKFLIMFDNSNLLFFPGQFLSGRVIVEVDDDMPVMGKKRSI